MARAFKLQVTSRREISKKARKQATSDRQVLGNIYGDGESKAIQGDYRAIYETVRSAGKTHPIKMVVDDKDEFDVLIRDVENNVLTHRLHHVTFRVIKKGEKIRVDVPIHLNGEAPGLKLGLILVHIIDEVTVETTPSNIPESFEVDIGHLEEDGDSVRLSEIAVDEEVTILEDPESVITKLEVPRAQLVEEETEEEEVEGEEEESSEEVSDDDDAEMIDDNKIKDQ